MHFRSQWPKVLYLILYTMLDIKLFRKSSNPISCTIVPNARNRYKCDVMVDGILHVGQNSYGSLTDGFIETSIQSDEDVKGVQDCLRKSWELPRETIEFHELIPGTFIKVDEKVYLINKREGRNLYCYTLEGKRTFKIPSKEYIPEFPEWQDVSYFWENYDN